MIYSYVRYHEIHSLCSWISFFFLFEKLHSSIQIEYYAMHSAQEHSIFVSIVIAFHNNSLNSAFMWINGGSDELIPL